MNKARVLAITIIAATGMLILTVFGMRILRGSVTHIDVSRAVHPVKGIDLSAHNGLVNFAEVAADSVEFVYLKATEGETFRDPLFILNYAKARDEGLRVGAYHFFRFDCEGWRQSYNLLQTIEGLHLDLPIAIDVEENGNPDAIQTDEIVRNLRSMVDYLCASGHRVVIYTNKNGFRRFIRGRFDDVPLWLCSFTDPPIHGQWTLWQHSHRGHVKGVGGPVDLDTFNGSRDDFILWLSETQ